MASESFAKVTLLGDAKSLVKAAKTGQKAMQNTQTAITKSARLISRTLGTFGVALSFAALTASMQKATASAIQDAKSQALLAKQMQNTVKATQLQTAAVEESISKMSIMASIPDDEIRPAFATLLRSTKSVAKATKLTSLALDVAAGTGRDVGTVSKALSKAYAGNTGALSKLGINVKKGGNWMKDLRKQFAGMADIAARKDPAKRLQVTFSELQEKLGQGMIPVLNKVADWFNANYDKIAKFFTDAWNSDFVNGVKDALKTVWEDYLVPFGKWLASKEVQDAFKNLNDKFKNLADSVKAFASSEIGQALKDFSKDTILTGLGALATILQAIADALDAIRGKAKPAGQEISNMLNPFSSTLGNKNLSNGEILNQTYGNFSNVGAKPANITVNVTVPNADPKAVVNEINKWAKSQGRGRLAFE